MSITEMDVLFHGLLKKVHHWNPSVIPNRVNIEKYYSTYQSLHQGATSKAQNVDTLEEVINTNNRWRKKYHLKGVKPSCSMMEHYLDVNIMALAPTLIYFSKELLS